MKTLYFSRHAQFSDNDTLTADGITQAKRLAKFLEQAPRKPQKVITSHLLRAFQTGKVAADELGVGIAKADGEFPSLEELRSLDNSLEVVLIVSHQPNIARIKSRYDLSLPIYFTTMIAVHFDIDNWSEFNFDLQPSGTAKMFDPADYPEVIKPEIPKSVPWHKRIFGFKVSP